MWTLVAKLAIIGTCFSLLNNLSITTSATGINPRHIVTLWRYPLSTRKRLWELFGSMYMLAHLCFALHEPNTIKYLQKFQISWIIYRNACKYLALEESFKITHMFGALAHALILQQCESRYIQIPLLVISNTINIYLYI